MEYYEMTISQTRDLLDRREATSVELVEAYLKRIRTLDGDLGAFITVDDAGALEAAREADRRIANSESTPLLGVPLALKDLLCTRGLRTTCGSRILENFVPEYDAVVVSRLREAGAVILGKTNMDEFAMGSSTENSGFHVTRNPWNRDHVPGGSSGGSAAAVAARMCVAALGSDTGGSIRQPASHCGVVGLKPTYGRVSRFGLVAYASSLDQIGPITRTVTDAALMMNVIAGFDAQDSTSATVPVPDFTTAISRFDREGLKGIRAGIPREFLSQKGLDPDVEQGFTRGVELLENLGVTMVDISLPRTDYAVAAYYVLAPSEASSNLARYDGVKYGFRDRSAGDLMEMYRKTRSKGFGEEVQRRILMGTYALSAGYYDEYYGRASRVRSLIMADFKAAFSQCDIILSPVAPTPAFRIGENVDDPLTMYLSDIYTLSANMAGIPGLSVPCAMSSRGLPIGLQIMADRFNEPVLIQAGYGFEQNCNLNAGLPAL
ncbi:MAG: Asp-tRNA(Asn)/Glu-tRNA(Gln) amidotransferase subunit GatA [Pseudomonadota bacterium]